MVVGAMLQIKSMFLQKFTAMLLLRLMGKMVNIKHLQTKFNVQRHDHGLSPRHPAGEQHHSEEIDGDDHGRDEGEKCEAADAAGAFQLGLDACRALRVPSLTKAPVSNDKEIKKSLKRKQDPGSRPHKDRKNGQNPKKNVGKDGVARLPSRPGTTPQKKMDEFLSVGGNQEKGERKPNKDPQDHFKDSWESEGLARHPSSVNRSLNETSPKCSNFRTLDRARPCAGNGKSEGQSAPVIKLDEPVPKWLKLWRAARPKPMAMSDPIENVEVFRMDTSEDEAVRAVRAL
jgi:hypothetical protein